MEKMNWLPAYESVDHITNWCIVRPCTNPLIGWKMKRRN